jgi:hypothetical protein
MSTKSQFDFLADIARLKAENPDATLHFMVSDELSGEFSYTAHEIFKVELGGWCHPHGSDCLFTKEDDLIEYLQDDLGMDESGAGNYVLANFEQAILVYTQATTEAPKPGTQVLPASDFEDPRECK